MTLLEQLEAELAEGGPRPWPPPVRAMTAGKPIRVCRRGHKVYPWLGRQRPDKGGWWECCQCEAITDAARRSARTQPDPQPVDQTGKPSF